MKIKDIFKTDNLDFKTVVDKSRKRGKANDYEELKKEWDVLQHKVNLQEFRPDRPVLDEDNKLRMEPVNRQPIAFQQIIVGRIVAFMFNNPVLLNAEPVGEPEELLLDSLKKLLTKVHAISHTKELAEHLFSMTEAAECWFHKKKKNNLYGFESEYQFRVRIFSPLLGDRLYPIFDKYDDLIAFGREYTLADENSDRQIIHFTIWTDEEFATYKEKDGEWELVENEINLLGKIPINYISQKTVEWYKVTKQIERFEQMLSDLGDSNQYHHSPTLVSKNATIIGFAKKGEQGKLLEIEGENASVDYITPANASESLTIEKDILEDLIFTLTQTINFSKLAKEGLGNISGIALRLLFLDAHLKVSDKRKIFDSFLARRVSILKSYLALAGPKEYSAAAETLEIEPEIQPFMIDDQAALIEMLGSAISSGTLSKKTGIAQTGLVDDAEAEYEQIQAEKKEAQAAMSFDPLSGE